MKLVENILIVFDFFRAFRLRRLKCVHLISLWFIVGENHWYLPRKRKVFVYLQS